MIKISFKYSLSCITSSCLSNSESRCSIIQTLKRNTTLYKNKQKTITMNLSKIVWCFEKNNETSCLWRNNVTFVTPKHAWYGYIHFLLHFFDSTDWEFWTTRSVFILYYAETVSRWRFKEPDNKRRREIMLFKGRTCSRICTPGMFPNFS